MSRLDEEQAETVRLVRHRARRDDDEIGDLPVRDVRLRAVEHPVIAAILGARLHAGEIAARARLGHRDRQDASRPGRSAAGSRCFCSSLPSSPRYGPTSRECSVLKKPISP